MGKGLAEDYFFNYSWIRKKPIVEHILEITLLLFHAQNKDTVVFNLTWTTETAALQLTSNGALRVGLIEGWHK